MGNQEKSNIIPIQLYIAISNRNVSFIETKTGIVVKIHAISKSSLDDLWLLGVILLNVCVWCLLMLFPASYVKFI